MGRHGRGPDGAVKIQPGDTLSAIVAEWYPNLQPGERRKLWQAFFRKVGPPPVPVQDPNKIYAGETLYFRPDLTAREAGPVTEGVRNASPRDAQAQELRILKEDLQQANTFIANASAALGQIDRRPKVEAWFRRVFVPSDGMLLGDDRKSVLGHARTVRANFQKMQQAARTVTFGVQDTVPLTTNGNYAEAYAMIREKRVVVWRDDADPRSYFQQSQS